MSSAGDSTSYRWRLYDKKKGKTVPDQDIDLDRVTHVIKRTLGKPELVGWTFYQNADYVAGFLSWAAAKEWANPPFDAENNMSLMDYLVDGDLFRELLKEYRMRTEDTTKDASDMGTEYHLEFEKIARYHLEIDPKEGIRRAEFLVKKFVGSHRGAIGQWWLDTQPNVIASELPLRSLEHRFAGTCDLAVLDKDGFVKLIDLKNRKEEKTVYDSDRVQMDAYEIAWDEMYPTDEVWTSSVLVAREDGTYHEEEVTGVEGTFLDLLKVYRRLKALDPKQVKRPQGISMAEIRHQERKAV